MTPFSHLPSRFSAFGAGVSALALTSAWGDSAALRPRLRSRFSELSPTDSPFASPRAAFYPRGRLQTPATIHFIQPLNSIEDVHTIRKFCAVFGPSLFAAMSNDLPGVGVLLIVSDPMNFVHGLRDQRFVSEPLPGNRPHETVKPFHRVTRHVAVPFRPLCIQLIYYPHHLFNFREGGNCCCLCLVGHPNKSSDARTAPPRPAVTTNSLAPRRCK